MLELLNSHCFQTFFVFPLPLHSVVEITVSAGEIRLEWNQYFHVLMGEGEAHRSGGSYMTLLIDLGCRIQVALGYETLFFNKTV